MDTWLQLQARVKARLPGTNNSSFYTTQRIKDALVDAVIWAYGKYSWKALEKAQESATVAAHDYYDYPPNMRTDSLTMVYIDGNLYALTDFTDFINWRTCNPTDTTKLCASYGRQFFIFPTPTITGSGNMDVWGIVEPAVLPSNDLDTTIFSYAAREGNSAIIKQAIAICKASAGNKQVGQVEDAEASAILAALWKKECDRRAKFQRKNHPFFKMPNLYPNFTNSTSKIIGNF